MESDTSEISDSHLELDLFAAVQRNEVFADSKRFVDCVPLSEPRRIARSFAAERDEPEFDLRSFVERHFEIPDAETPNPELEADDVSMEEHIGRLWSHLTRDQTKRNEYDTRISLPNPHVVPGGRFREVYYWDSYFVAEGLAATGRFDAVVDMVDNFAALIDEYGYVPNGNRTYYLSRSQLPLFCRMVALLVRRDGVDAATPYLPRIEREYSFWMDGDDEVSRANPAHRRVVRLGDAVLNRYWDDDPSPRTESYREDRRVAARLPADERSALYRHIRAACESGWDFSSRWLAEADDFASIRTTDLVPVDLNAALYDVERKLAAWFDRHDSPEVADEYRTAARRRRTAVDEYCWDADAGFYFDYCWPDDRRTDRWTLAAVAPLYFEAASDEQAAAVATALEERFLETGGLLTTLTRSGEQWDAPNGWAPLQRMAIGGLRRYGFDDLADEVERRWLDLNRRVFAEAGKLVEKYDVTDPDREAGGGEYPLQDGFGWTNGVVVALQNE